MPRLILALLTLALASCASWRTATTEIALPAATDLPCCWQSQERVRITGNGSTQSLLSVIERSGEQLTVAMLAPTGQPLIVLRHDRDGVHTLQAPPGWDTQLNSAILAAIYLHQRDGSEWQRTNPAWRVDADKNSRALLHKGKIIALIHYPDPGNPSLRKVFYPGHAVQLDITTLSRTPF